jgi:hypothetical protein
MPDAFPLPVSVDHEYRASAGKLRWHETCGTFLVNVITHGTVGHHVAEPNQCRSSTMIDVAMVELADGSVARIDAVDLALVASYEWRLPSASRRGGQHPVGQRRGCRELCDTVYLHRLIAQAGPDDVVVHRNHDTLDNRRENLVVMARQSLHIGQPLNHSSVTENFAAD